MAEIAVFAARQVRRPRLRDAEPAEIAGLSALVARTPRLPPGLTRGSRQNFQPVGQPVREYLLVSLTAAVYVPVTGPVRRFAVAGAVADRGT